MNQELLNLKKMDYSHEYDFAKYNVEIYYQSIKFRR